MGLPADLLRRRPDIRAAERSLAAETARIGVATADLYPSFSLTGSFGLASGNTSSLLKSGSEFFTLGLPFSWNLFDGGRVRSQIKAQDAVAEQALLNYEQTVLAALNEVDNAYVAYTQQRIRVQALARTVAASERSLALAIKLYKDGLSDFQSVLDAQRTLFSYDDYYAAAKGEAAYDLVLLYKALGGGWDASSRPHPAPGSPRAPGSAEKKIQEAKK
jgi:outer membrane protein TolC